MRTNEERGLQRWVVLTLISVAVVVLIALVMALSGGGSGHGPARHGMGEVSWAR